MAHYQGRQFAKAAEQFRLVAEAGENAPHYRESVLLLGQSLYLSSQAAAAIPWIEKALTWSALSTELNYMLGNAAIQARQTDKARGAFARMFGVEPASAAAHLITAQMMVRLEFNELAEEQLQAALRLDPRIPEAHYLLGILAAYRSKIDMAVEELTQEIAINPNFAMAYYKLGDAYTRRDEWDRAIPPLQKSIWLNPSYSGPYILLGKCYFRRGELGNAEGMLRQAVALDPNNYSAHYLLGQTLLKAGRAEEGRQFLTRSQTLRKTKDEIER
jgi:tetratricopeptide (TPR) repeat protein